ncbi:RNA polymerase sigma factor [Kitasatospora sp. NPDC008050]|uniref:RNA polymerase sigma factor n=1 Tax=Kitasatospora sp. NPDC008050 TaxID=3364021 RepID=UPI0036E1E1F8
MAVLGMDPGFRARVRAGDESAFDALFSDFGTRVYNHCFRLTADWSAAEDCTSLVFMEAWRLRSRVEPDGGCLLPWLLGIATNVVHRHRRVARRHRALMDRMPEPRALPDFADELVARMADQQRVAAVGRSLRLLPRVDRDVLALCVWAGLDYASAAEALGVAVGTVRSRLSRARRRLDKLAEANPGPGMEHAHPARQVTDNREYATERERSVR